MEDNFNKIINGVKNDLLKIKRKNQSEICKSKPKKIRLDHRYFQFDLLGQHSLCHHAESNSVFFCKKKTKSTVPVSSNRIQWNSFGSRFHQTVANIWRFLYKSHFVTDAEQASAERSRSWSFPMKKSYDITYEVWFFEIAKYFLQFDDTDFQNFHFHGIPFQPLGALISFFAHHTGCTVWQAVTKYLLIIFRLPPGCLQLHLHPNGYQIVLSEPKQQSAFIPYSNREILSAIESGRMPAILSDWITPEKIKISNQNLIKCAILEKNSAGQTLSTRLIDLKNNSHGYRVFSIVSLSSVL